jgi:Domain of unknown function DUF29
MSERRLRREWPTTLRRRSNGSCAPPAVASNARVKATTGHIDIRVESEGSRTCGMQAGFRNVFFLFVRAQRCRSRPRPTAKLLRCNPSLRGHVEEVLAEEYPAAVAGALDETGLPDGAFPATCPYSAEQLQDHYFLPD